MTEIEIGIPVGADPAQFERDIETAAVATGLDQRLKGSLVKYPGAIHWHFCKPGARGTLELTLWPQQRRCWISLRESRSGDWIADAVRELLSAINSAMRSQPK